MDASGRLLSTQEAIQSTPVSGHPRDRDLVSVIARVRNSGMRENFYFKPYLQRGGHMCVHFY